MTAGEIVLSVTGASKRYGGLQALHDVNMNVRAGQIKGLIGPNGAGKTTLFHVISGFERLDSGAITARGERIDRLPPYAIARLGIVRSFQIVQPFRTLRGVMAVEAGVDDHPHVHDVPDDRFEIAGIGGVPERQVRLNPLDLNQVVLSQDLHLVEELLARLQVLGGRGAERGVESDQLPADAAGDDLLEPG